MKEENKIEKIEQRIEQLEKKLPNVEMQRCTTCNVIHKKGQNCPFEEYHKWMFEIKKDVEATNTALGTHYERINEFEKRLETLGINVNYIRYKMSDLEKKINDFSNYIHDGIGNTVINNKNEINGLKEKITWLSEENAKLYTQVDNDALKRANLEKVLRKLLSKLDGKEKDSESEKQRDNNRDGHQFVICPHSGDDSKLSEEKLDGKIITTEETVDKCKEFARKVQEEIKDFQNDRESVVMNDPITKAYMKEIKENFPNLKEHEIDTSRALIEEEIEKVYGNAHQAWYKSIKKKASGSEKENFRITKKGKYYDKSKGHTYPCKSCLYEFNSKDDNTCGKCHTYSYNGEYFIEFFKAWKPKERDSGGEKSVETSKAIELEDVRVRIPASAFGSTSREASTNSKLSESNYPVSLINLINTTDFEEMAYLDWYKLIWDTAIKQWKIDNSCDINATYYVKGQRKMQKELIEEFVEDWNFLYDKIYNYLQKYRRKEINCLDIIITMMYFYYETRKKKWEERLK